MTTEQEIRAQLDEIQDPCSCASGAPMGIEEMGLVGSVEIGADGDVQINLRLTSPFCHMIPFLQSEAKSKVGALDGVRSVTVKGDQGLDWSPEMITAEARERRARILQERFARAVGAT